MIEKYGDISSQPQFDADAWHQTVGGIGHGHLYGFGKENPRDILGAARPSRSSSSTSVTSGCPPIQTEQVDQILNQVMQRLDGILVPRLQDVLRGMGIQIPNPTSEVSPAAQGQLDDDVHDDDDAT